MDIPAWALSLSYWLHMLATVAWLGGLAFITLFIVPAAKNLSTPEDRAGLLENAQRRLDPLAWFSLILLTGTGLMQMSANPNYDGFLAFTNNWALAILLKHVVFIGMAGVSAAITWSSLPALRREILRQTRGKGTPNLEKLQKRNLNLLRLNLVLGIIVLGFTAAARAL